MYLKSIIMGKCYKELKHWAGGAAFVPRAELLPTAEGGKCARHPLNNKDTLHIKHYMIRTLCI